MEDKQQIPLGQEATGGPPPDLSRIDQITTNQSLDEPITSAESIRTTDSLNSETPVLEVTRSSRFPWKAIGIAMLALLVIGGSVWMFSASRNKPSATMNAGDFDTLSVPLGGDSPDTTIGSSQKLTVNGRLQVAESIIMSPSTLPASGVIGQLLYDQTTNTLAYFNGTQFVRLGGGGSPTIIGGSGDSTIVNNNTIIQGGSGGGGAALSGTPGTLVKFTGVSEVGDSIASDTGSALRVTGNVNLVSTVTIPTTELIALDGQTPTLTDLTDANQSLELGVKFRTDVSGFVRGVRFWKGTFNTGTHTGSLWSSGGTLLATGTFTNETASGWQELRFATPVAVSADTTYVASYHSSQYYSATPEYFKPGSADNGSLHLLRDGDDGGNGVYSYGATTVFPTRTSQGSNYFVDVIFLPNPPPNQYQINNVQISSADLANNLDIAKRSSSQTFTGNNTFRSSVDNASSFSIQAADGTPQFIVSTEEFRVHIGQTVASNFPTILVLSNKANAGDPLGTEGAIYYNANSRSFRCYRSGIWDNCAQPEVDHSFAVYEEFLGGQNTSFVTDSFGTLGWKAQAIGANGSVSYDPGAPIQTDTRPGILRLETPAIANQGTTFALGSGSVILTKDNIVKTGVAVGSVDQVLRVGLHTQTTGTAQPLSGVWWEADTAASTQWRYCSGDGTTPTCTDSSVAVTPDTWVRLELRILTTGTNTSSFQALINGTLTSRSGITIDTTNRVAPAYSCFTTNGTAQSCYWDYYQFKGTTSSGR